MRIFRFVRLTIGLIFIMMILSSCSLFSNNVTSTEPANQDPQESDIISNPALSRSGALVVAIDQLDGTFNPMFSDSTVENWIEDLVFDGLFVFDSNGELSNALGDSFDISDDGLSYTVTLKEDLYFHDGSKVQVSDVIFTYETILNPEYQGEYKDAIDGLMNVSILDDYNVVFSFETDSRENLQALVVPILSENYYKFTVWNVFKDGYKPPMGTGPFVFDTYNNDENLVLIKNTKYWTQNAKISGVVIKEMDDATATQAFVDGTIDLYKLPNSKSRVNEIKELGYSNVITQKTNVYTFIGMNLNLPVLSELNIRKALIYALDREKFTNEEWSGFADTIQFLATSIEEYSVDNSSLEKYTHNLEKAKELLDIIGFRDDDGDGIREKNGEKLTFTWKVFSDVDWSYNLAQYAREQWKILGIDVRLEYLDYTEMIQLLESGQIPDMWNLAWEMGYNTSPVVLFGSDESRATYNYSNYSSEEANQLFEVLEQSKSSFEKEAILKEWHLIQNNDLPYIPIARLKTVWAYNSRIKNLTINDYALWTDNVTSIEIDILQ